jgi:hypothetical protein
VDAVNRGNGPALQTTNGSAGWVEDGQLLDHPPVLATERMFIDRQSTDATRTLSGVDPRAERYMPGIAAFRHPIITLIPVLVFAVLGAAYGSSRPPIYSAESRILVGRLDVTAQAVPGYVSATESLAGVYSRLVSLPTVHDDALSRIGHPINPQSAVSASPIPLSSEIRVDATSPVQADAVRLADTTTAAMVAYISRLNAPVPMSGPTLSDLQARYDAATSKMETAAQTVDQLNTQLASLRDPKSALSISLSNAAHNALDASVQQQLIPARATVDQGKEEMNQLDSQMRALLATAPAPIADSEGVTRAIQPAVAGGVDRTRKLELDTAGGVVVGGALGLLLASGYDEWRRRRPRSSKLDRPAPA